MLFCDICNKEITTRRDILKRITLPYEFSCKAFQNKEFDICTECHQSLNLIITQMKLDFVNTNGLMIKEDKKREGRWKGAGLGDYACSLCGGQYSGADHFKYCPDCGAKMYD